MRFNPIARLFKGGERPATKLMTITPPRTGERTMLGVENLLSSIAIPEPFSLEIVGDSGGVSLLARCRDGSFVRQQVGGRYPQAKVDEVSQEDDPLRLSEGEQAYSMSLRLKGPEYLPLRTFRDDDLLDPGSDPLISIIGSLSDLEEGERLVARLRLLSLGPDWSSAYQEKAYGRPLPDPKASPYHTDERINRNSMTHLAILGVFAVPALQCYLWIQRGETWKAALLGLGAASLAALAGWAWWRIKKWRSGGKHQDPLLIKEKVSRIAYEAQLEVTAILSEHGTEGRARELLRNVASAYSHYNNPAGASFRATKVRPGVPDTEPSPPGRGLFHGRDVLGVRELAALWHPLGAGDQLPMVACSGARALFPSSRNGSGGAYVGDTVVGRPRKVHFPGDAMGRHHLYVARTRMGKSTLMHHLIVHKMREKAAGRNDDAIVVVDPHDDLVKSLLKHVPEEIVEKVYLIDLNDDERSPGIYLLDARIFPDRDRTTDSVVRISKGLWDQWGPRMQSILEHTVKSLHEYNTHPDTGEDEQCTILDGLRLLSDLNYRKRVLRRVSDPYVLGWWARDFRSWTRTLRADAVAPVQTRLAYYASSKKARAILGQRRSTLDLRQVIAEGGVLLVATSQSAAGQDVSALVGASLLNLTDAVIREQGRLSPERRRGALVVVDEMQSMPGVDYESMLSELGKFGASFILATQSLARLKELSPTMQDTLLANVGCLAVFQVAASDARQLIGELDRERLDEEDLVSLPAHHCYVRATVDGLRQPTYSLGVREPEEGNPAAAERVLARAEAYTTTAEVIASQDPEVERMAQEYRDQLEREEAEQQEGGIPPPPSAGNGTAGQPGAKKKKPRTRRRGGNPDSTGGGPAKYE